MAAQIREFKAANIDVVVETSAKIKKLLAASRLLPTAKLTLG